MAVKIEIGMSELIFISMNVAHERGSQDGRLFEEITEYITYDCGEKNYLAIAGDMNAHLAQLAELEDARGWLLKISRALL